MKKIFKAILAISIIGAMALGFAACGGNGGGAEAHVNGAVNKLIEFHNHGCLQSQTTALAFLYPRLSESDKAF